MNKLPTAKSVNIIVQNLNDEVLIYDLTINKAFCLNDTSAKVYNACDGVQTFEDLKRRYKFTDDLILFAIDELKANNLIEDYQSSHFAGLSRREVMRRVGLASIVALPLITGLVVPTSASAASVCASTACTTPAGCPSPCRSCAGPFTCTVGGAQCPVLGDVCVVTGTCVANPFGGGNCSVGGGICFNVGAVCTLSGICTGNCA